jgi:hypothetical protein
MRAAAAFRRESIFLLALLTSVCIAACGAPGVPTPPRPVVPKPVTDLAGRQQGSSVVLTFTLPKKSDENETLSALPSIEIFRGERATGAPGRAAKTTTQLIYTVPSALVDTYLKDGLIEFRDPLKPESLRGQDIVYMVRARASTKRASVDSNIISVRVLPVPPAPTNVHVAALKESAIELGWTAPRQETAAGSGIAGYRVYRGELPAGAAVPSGEIADTLKLKMSVPLALVGPAPGNSFRDTDFTFGTTYIYVVRTVEDQQSQPVESSDSAPLIVTPKDIFPPAAPQRLVAVPMRNEQATGNGGGVIELSWDINQETDLQGYYVYRSEQPGTTGERITKSLLLTPTFRDNNAMPGKQYTYRVTAVDRSGNESQLSSPVTAAVPLQRER